MMFHMITNRTAILILDAAYVIWWVPEMIYTFTRRATVNAKKGGRWPFGRGAYGMYMERDLFGAGAYVLGNPIFHFVAAGGYLFPWRSVNDRGRGVSLVCHSSIGGVFHLSDCDSSRANRSAEKSVSIYSPPVLYRYLNYHVLPLPRIHKFAEPGY